MKQSLWQFACLMTAAVCGFFPCAIAQSVTGRVVVEFACPPEVTGLRLPTAVALAAGGAVYVLDGVHDRIVTFDASGRFTGELAPAIDPPLQQPVGLRAARDGRLWIADSANSRLVVLAADGTVVETLAIPPAADGRAADPTDVAVSEDGNRVWVADNDNHRVLRLDRGTGAWSVFGGLGEALGQWQYPFQMMLGANDELFVSDVINGRVQVLAADGVARRSIGGYGVELGQMYRPGGVAVDASGDLWVADSVAGVVQAFHRDGALRDVLRDPGGQPMRFEAPLGLAFDAAGALYVVESRANRVRRVEITSGPAPLIQPDPPRGRVLGGQQARGCTICHYEWMQPFAEGRDSTLAPRPAARANEPFVSSSEMCLSCHDGSVDDSRRRVWDDHGHRTGVKPPAGMTVPSHLPLVDGVVACRTCHSAHGNEAAQADFRRAVVLRVANTAGELCGSCHTDKLGGPRFGTHPTGGMPWEIPAALVAAGAKVGPNPRELTCQVCHTPHGAKFDHLLVMETTSSQLCLTCHDQMRPGMFRPGGHMEHPLAPLVNPDQAAVIHELGTRLGPGGELVCLSCHKLHHGRGGRFLLADELSEGQMCLRCHTERQAMLGTSHDLRTNFPEERNRLGMTPADGGPCSACHLFHRYARAPAPGVGDDVGHCLSCHSDGACAEKKTLSGLDHPSPRCTTCHDPHETKAGHFLRESPAQLCTTCHAEQAAIAGGAHDSTSKSPAWCALTDRAGDRCLSCHRPHGDAAHGLWRVAPVADAAMPDAACIACHPDAAASSGTLALLHPQTAADGRLDSVALPLVQRADGGNAIGCYTCHDPHGGATRAGALLRTADVHGGIDLCVSCHTDMRQVVVTAHSAAAMTQHGFSAQACGPCHQVHGDPKLIKPDLLWPTALAAADAPASDAQCVGCHRADGGAKAPRIATHPDVPLFDPLASTGGGLPLFDAAGRRDPVGKIGCPTCHLPHGRPMPDLPLDAQRTPELRAQRIQLRPFDPPNACTACHGADALWRFLYFHDPARRNAPQGTR